MSAERIEFGQHRYLPDGTPITIVRDTVSGVPSPGFSYVHGHHAVWNAFLSDLAPMKLEKK